MTQMAHVNIQRPSSCESSPENQTLSILKRLPWLPQVSQIQGFGASSEMTEEAVLEVSDAASEGTGGGGGGTDIHYPKYELYGQYKYSGGQSQDQQHCSYQAKYGEDCHMQQQQPRMKQQEQQCQYNKTWPKQHYQARWHTL